MGRHHQNFGPPHSSSARTSLTPEDSFDHSKSETFACFSISTKRTNLFVVKLRFKLEIYSIVGNVEKCTLEHRVSTTTNAATTAMVETEGDGSKNSRLHIWLIIYSVH